MKGHKESHLGLGSDRRRGFEISFAAKLGAKASLNRCSWNNGIKGDGE